MIKRSIIYFTTLVSLTWLFDHIELNYVYADLNEYFSVLLIASSMVFTIMGIWIAFLYPNALRRLVDPETIENADFSQTLSETKRLEGLVGSVLSSAFVVTMIMIIYFGKTIASSLPLPSDYIDYIKRSTLSFAFILGAIQVESIIHVIYSNIMFINDLHSKREDREADQDI